MRYPPQIRSLGALKESGWKSRSVRDELRGNLLERIRSDIRPFPGLHGYGDTVEKALVQAILSRHDILLLGLRGQGKTRLLRELPVLLDEWMPTLAGTELREDPFSPVPSDARRLVEEALDDAPVEWIHRDERYREKLATPDTSMADLIGDIDPVKAVSGGFGFGHERSIQWGIVPRSNRGVFAINELPDLQPRIQVGLLNLLEERDLQIRGIPLRVPLDVFFAFSANPEDYTRRGNLITPLKDRIGSQILTHYPRDLATSRAITDQEAWTERRGAAVRIPAPLRDLAERLAFEARETPELVDPRSGVSQRLPIALLETLHSAVEARCARLGSPTGEARLVDLHGCVPAVAGKLELAHDGDDPAEVARKLLAKACGSLFDEVFRSPSGPGGDRLDFPVTGWFESGCTLTFSDNTSDEAHREELDSLQALDGVMRALSRDPSWDPGADRIAWREIVLEGLFLHDRIGRRLSDGGMDYSQAPSNASS